MQKPESLSGLPPSADRENSASGSPASGSKSSQSRVMFSDIKDGRRKSLSRKGDDASAVESFPERTQAGELFRAAGGGRHLPPVSGSLLTSYLLFMCCGRKDSTYLNELRFYRRLDAE